MIAGKTVQILRLKEKKGQTEHRTAQPLTLATFRSWGSSAGAGRAGLPGGKDRRYLEFGRFFFPLVRYPVDHGMSATDND